MESKFHSLPPLKQKLSEKQKEYESSLPAKKRINCRDPIVFSESLAPKTTKDAVFLPAKKRVWAVQPDFSPDTPKTLKNTFCLPAKKRVLAIRPDFSPDKCSFAAAESEIMNNPKNSCCLPAKKRFSAFRPDFSPDKCSAVCLPAKKRVWAIRSDFSPDRSSIICSESETPEVNPTTICLPAKKRVWAVRPDGSPIKCPVTFPESKTLETFSTVISLPANKRVCARRTDFSPVKSPIVCSESETPEPPQTAICLPAKECVLSVRSGFSPVKSSIVCSESETLEISLTTICLPAKKRVWASKPDFSPVKSTHSCLSFDLNVDYTPSPEKKPGNETELEEQIQCENEEEEDEEDDGILCAVCESTDGDPSDPIVFCDGCDLMVHASCYGNPLVKGIPDGDWFCAQCSISKETPSSSIVGKCCLCPVRGGAMKPTTDGQWAHIVCAVLVPEVFFLDPEGREGINYSNVPKRRWKQTCYVCKQRKGCSVECSEPKCPLAFHVSCGLKEELCIELKEGKYCGGSGIVAGFCKKHTELWKKQQQSGKFKIVAREDGDDRS